MTHVLEHLISSTVTEHTVRSCSHSVHFNVTNEHTGPVAHSRTRTANELASSSVAVASSWIRDDHEQGRDHGTAAAVNARPPAPAAAASDVARLRHCVVASRPAASSSLFFPSAGLAKPSNQAGVSVRRAEGEHGEGPRPLLLRQGCRLQVCRPRPRLAALSSIVCSGRVSL